MQRSDAPRPTRKARRSLLAGVPLQIGFLALVASLAVPSGLQAQERSARGSSEPEAAVPDATVPESENPDAADEQAEDSYPKFNAGGDFRFRLEADRDRRNAEDRERARIRFRVFATAEIFEGLTLGARLVTAPSLDDPNSTHTTLGNGFRAIRVALDRAYVDYRIPTQWPFHVMAGKFPNQFRNPDVYNELIWDNDIQPEGAATTLDPVGWLHLLGGYYTLLNQGSGEDIAIGVLQAVATGNVAEDWRLRGAFGGQLYEDITPDAASSLLLFNQGNAVITDPVTGEPIAFASDFNIWTGFGEVTYEGWARWPVTVMGQVWSNTSAPDSLDGTGWATGAAVGKLGIPMGLRFAYQYQQVGQESVFSALIQDDFLDATNFNGHVASVTWQYIPVGRIRLWALISKRREPPDDIWQKRFRLDFDFAWRVR